MGASVSKREAAFVTELKKFQEDDCQDVTPVIYLAGQLDSLNFVSYTEIQQLLRKQSNNIIMLFIKSLDYMATGDDMEVVRGALTLLSKLLPTVLLSASEVSELDWLFGGTDTLIARLYGTIKRVLFSSKLFGEEAWKWEKIPKEIANARADIMFMLLCGFINKFFIDDASINDRMMRLCLADKDTARKLVESIVGAIKGRETRFLQIAIPYANAALIHDANFAEAVKGTDLMKEAVDLLYTSIERSNSFISSGYSVESIEIDLIILVTEVLLKNLSSNFDVTKAAAVFVRILQLANETNTTNVNHRIALVGLSVLTSSKSRCTEMSRPLKEPLGTGFEFHRTSLALVVFEAATITLLSHGAAELYSLIISVVHNVAPYIKQNIRIAEHSFAKCIAFAASKSDTTLCDGLIIAIQRCSILSRDIVRNAVKEYLENYEQWPERQKFEESMAEETQQSESPLIISNPDFQLQWTKSVIINLFRNRTKIKLGTLKH